MDAFTPALFAAHMSGSQAILLALLLAATASLLLRSYRRLNASGRPAGGGVSRSGAAHRKRFRDGNRLGRALYVAKHRGSYCHDALVRFDIGERGVQVETAG